MKICDRLRELREQTGKTQGEVADSLGVGRITYQNYERDVSKPNAETILKMCKYFNVSSDYLLGNTNFDSNEYLLALSGKSLGELTDDQKVAVKNVIDTFLKQNKK